jgi:hypothetical protein
MIGWFDRKYHEEWLFGSYELRGEDDQLGEGRFKAYRFNKNVAELPGLDNAELTIRNLWETTRGSFMIMAAGKKEVQYKGNAKMIPQVNLVLDTVTNTMR